MEIVRILQLKDKDGALILNWEEDPLCVKYAAYYLDKKTDSLTDEEFLDWIRDKAKNGIFMGNDKYTFEADMFTDEFSFLRKHMDKIPTAMGTVLGMLVSANKSIGSEYKGYKKWL